MLHLFEQHHYRVKQSILSQYIYSMDNMSPYFYASDERILGYPHIIRLLSNAQIRKERAFTFSQLAQIANPAENTKAFYTQMQSFVQSQVFYRGYRLQCDTCSLDRWYALENVGESLTCGGCRNKIFIPLEQPFAYQLNPLWAEGIKNGALTILLTIDYFREKYQNFEWEVGLIISKAGQSTEIDLAIYAEDHFHLIECKDTLPTKTDDLQAQLERNLIIANEIGATVMLSTLANESFSADLSDYLQNQQIELLSAKQLMTSR